MSIKKARKCDYCNKEIREDKTERVVLHGCTGIELVKGPGTMPGQGIRTYNLVEGDLDFCDRECLSSLLRELFLEDKQMKEGN